MSMRGGFGGDSAGPGRAVEVLDIAGSASCRSIGRGNSRAASTNRRQRSGRGMAIAGRGKADVRRRFGEEPMATGKKTAKTAAKKPAATASAAKSDATIL